MIFEEAVRKAVEETSGGLAAVIMARDGIALSQYVKPEIRIDLETLGIEYSNLLAAITRAAETIGTGAVKEVSLATDSYTTLIRILNPEYFMALILSPQGNLGKGRFLLRVLAPSLLREF
jgi:predicted regulator of Ras-like GTPase activity (Roadblock/LC7/MglB family)